MDLEAELQAVQSGIDYQALKAIEQSMRDTEQSKLLEYRRDHFDVMIQPSRISEFDNELVLSITHNGFQWQSISLLPEEVSQVIRKLSEALERKKLKNSPQATERQCVKEQE